MLNKLPRHYLRKAAIPTLVLLFLTTTLGITIRFVKKLQPSSIISSTDIETSVNPGEKFTLKKGETAKVRGLNVTLTITNFIYSPCPEDTQCFWNGLAVDYELTVDGKIYKSTVGNLPSEAPYQIFMKESDYKTYAVFVIDKPEKDTISNQPAGYLEGNVTIGPLCPLEPCQISDEDRKSTVISQKIPVYTDQTRILQAMIIPDNQGNYHLELPSGRYWVGDKKYEGNVFSKDLPKEILIESGKTARLNINIDTGIR